ncbi:hemin importer ATP-binding protein [Marinibactrum halimedae]|uniref:Hemin importer ATP-binding protein n=1 Tax=Marinibactrum halimedae TaxID=1444977 RepID=A0AA37TDA8_9GAMM|nr:hemin importer ATP-binding protein [Marinibactrum halimedae]
MVVKTRYSEKRLLDKVSVTVHPNEFVAIVGPNGAGKSTLLKAMSGEFMEYTVPRRSLRRGVRGMTSAGVAALGDRVLSELPAEDRAKRIAVLPQASTLPFDYTVEEVVRLGLFPWRLSVKDANEVVRQALISADLLGFEQRHYLSLSGGERQRTHFARVLVQVMPPALVNPAFSVGSQYLLLDEPTSALDLSHQHALMQAASQHARHVGVVVVMHDLNLALQYASRCILVNRGQVVEQGTPTDIFTPDCIADVFGVKAHRVSGKAGQPQLLFEPLMMDRNRKR